MKDTPNSKHGKPIEIVCELSQALQQESFEHSRQLDVLTGMATTDGELDTIAEGLYRWTIDCVNQSIELSPDGLQQPILGTGKAPLLSPSETKEALTTYINKYYIRKEE